MSGRRLFAIAVIFVLASAAWMALAGSVQIRTSDFSGNLGEQVGALWGNPQVQRAPVFSYSDAGSGSTLPIQGSELTADFRLEQRRKGLLWYSTYVVDFDATYRVSNPATSPATAKMVFEFPDPDGIYDGFAVRVGGSEVPVSYDAGRAIATFALKPGHEVDVMTGYRTNGMDSWTYLPSPGGPALVTDFRFVMTTDFDQVDYPPGGSSPTTDEPTETGRRLTWAYQSVVSGRQIGIITPKPQNPGPLVARITLFAPLSLLFFFASLILLSATRSIRLHPMHYGFLAAAFFAFDLLLAYLADQVDIDIAFAIASIVSVGLVVGYLRVVIGPNRALAEIALAQLIFLVLFSYSFFFEGVTGLAITIGAVLTLAFFMYRTARVDWETAFAPKTPAGPA